MAVITFPWKWKFWGSGLVFLLVCWLLAAQTGPRDMKHHHCGGEGRSELLWEVRQVQADTVGHILYTQLCFWNQTTGEGLDSPLSQSSPGWQTLGGWGDTQDPLRVMRCRRVPSLHGIAGWHHGKFTILVLKISNEGETWRGGIGRNSLPHQNLSSALLFHSDFWWTDLENPMSFYVLLQLLEEF